MKKQIQEYINYCNNIKEANINKDLIEDIKTHIVFFQHERLIHLLITLFVALCSIIFFVISLFHENILIVILFFLFIILFIPYILHYYFLENNVQSIYLIYKEINNKYQTKK